MKKRKGFYWCAIIFGCLTIFCLLPFNAGIGQIRKDISPVKPSQTYPHSEIRPKEELKISVPLGIYSFSAEPSTINFGEEVILRWRFRSNYAGQLRVTIEGIQIRGIYMTINPQWKVVYKSSDPSKEPDILEGTYTFRPNWVGYTDLKIKISHMLMDKVLASFDETTRGRGVRVNRYNLEAKVDVIQDPTPKVKFYVENKSSQYGGAYKGRLRFSYGIKRAHSSLPQVVGGNHDFGNITLLPGNKTQPIDVPLEKEFAFATDAILISGTLTWESPYPGEGEQSARISSTHTWVQKQGNLGDSLIIQICNSLLGPLKIHIHNHGKQESYVELPLFSIKEYFDIPEIRRQLKVLGVHWGWYRIWIRDINNKPPIAISIAEGGIRVNISIEANGPEEIKCVYDPVYIGGYTDDYACPDVDLRGPINAKVVLIPAVVGGQIGYSHANVDVTIQDTTFPGEWDWFIELFTGDLKPKIEAGVERALKVFLESAKVKDEFIKAIKKHVLRDVTRVTKIELRGSDLLYWYL